MVDSSIGGKAAINFRKTINGIGSYYHPIFNLIDIGLVESLSERDLRSGLAEVIKCAIIDDAEFFDYLKNNHKKILNRDEEAIEKCINDAIHIKIKYVQDDVREGYKRLHLNYGHTLGHSIEISTTDEKGNEQLRHGEGVAIGSVAVAYIADNYLSGTSTLQDYIDIFSLFELPVFLDSKQLGFDRQSLLDECIANVNKDKKRINNKLRLILSDKTGSSSVFTDVPFSLVKSAFDYIIK
jgi:3-dehydroquinate synthase